jgi:hypothetical protein
MAPTEAGPAHAVAPETGPAIAGAIALLRDMALLRDGANSRIPPTRLTQAAVTTQTLAVP